MKRLLAGIERAKYRSSSDCPRTMSLDRLTHLRGLRSSRREEAEEELQKLRQLQNEVRSQLDELRRIVKKNSDASSKQNR